MIRMPTRVPTPVPGYPGTSYPVTNCLPKNHSSLPGYAYRASFGLATKPKKQEILWEPEHCKCKS
eukprot:2341573-Rhodomonas_salina.1